MDGPSPLYTFWEPFVGSRFDIWDVWMLQTCIVATLTVQGFLVAGLLLGLLRIYRVFTNMHMELQAERQSFLTTGVITSDSPRICATIMKEEGLRRHRDLKGYIRLLGKELEEYKERFLATQGLLVVLKNHTAPLLGEIPETLRGIQQHLDVIGEAVDDTLKQHLDRLGTKLDSFEQEFQGQREKIAESLRRQNQTVERTCVNLGLSLQELHARLDQHDSGKTTSLEEPVGYISDTAHALDDKVADLAIAVDVVSRKVDQVNARLESLRWMIQELTPNNTEGPVLEPMPESAPAPNEDPAETQA